jgi:hypothetical protein
MFEPTDGALAAATRAMDELITADVLGFESRLMHAFPRLTVAEYSAVLGAYALAHAEQTRRAFVRSFGAELLND